MHCYPYAASRPLPRSYPPTINDPAAAALVADVARRLASATSAAAAATTAAGVSAPAGQLHTAAGQLPAMHYEPLAEPSLAAEDFSFYSHRLPAGFMFLGIGSGDKGTAGRLAGCRACMVLNGWRVLRILSDCRACMVCFLGGGNRLESVSGGWWAPGAVGASSAKCWGAGIKSEPPFLLPTGTNVSLHNPGFQMDEAQLPLGAALHVSVALEALTRLAAGGSLKPVAPAAAVAASPDARCEGGETCMA